MSAILTRRWLLPVRVPRSKPGNPGTVLFSFCSGPAVTWFRVDDTLAFHRKALAAGNAAMGLWVRAGSWCAQQLSDGFIPADIALTIGTEYQASALVKAGLWDVVEGGYEFHEWTEEGRQPTREDVLARRAADRARKSDWRRSATAQSKIKRNRSRNEQNDTPGVQFDPISKVPQVSGGCPLGIQAESARNPSGVRSTRPVPKRRTHLEIERHVGKGVGSGEGEAKSQAEVDAVVATPRGRDAENGKRIPDNFAVTPAMVNWAREHAPNVDGKRETEKFIDYWKAKSGKDATKKDWVATWRNWMRNAAERTSNRGTRKATADEKIAGWEAMKDRQFFETKEIAMGADGDAEQE